MMLEQTLINPNFIGRDGFKWFLGLVANTEPDQYSHYGSRAQVRILGYHGEEIAEKDLPWAHVLVPLTMGGGTNGRMMQGSIETSSLVVGFFADGDDAQQPIIIGSFYNGFETKVPIKFADGSKYFTLYQPKIFPANPSNIAVNRGQKVGVQTSTGSNASAEKANGVVTPQGEAATQDGKCANSVATETLNQSEVVSIPGHCKDANTGFNKILDALKNFIKVLNTVNQVANGFVNPVLNKLTNLDEEIRTIGSLISDWVSNQFKWVRDQIIIAIYDQLKKWLSQIKLPPWAEQLKKVLIGELTDGIWCAIGKILKKITSFITDFLFGLIGNIVSFPLCAAEAFLGSTIQTITNEIADAIQPLTDQISSIIGPIGTVTSYVNNALGYARNALTFLICDDNPCKEYFDYEINVGFVPKGSIENLQESLNNFGAQGIANLLDQNNAQKWLGNFGGEGGIPGEGTSLLSNCNIFSVECGPPKVSIFGGGGSGATGNAVIDSRGGIFGVNITNPGSGYSQPPYVRFDDACDNGRGAYGVARIGVVVTGTGTTTVGVTSVTMYYPGSGYLGPIIPPDTDPCKVTAFDESGSAVVGTIVSVNILKTGIGYSATDRIYDAACPNDVEMYPIVDDAGRIYDVRIVNPGTAINVTPNLQINSQNGFGAVLIPTLTFKPISGVTTETTRSKIQTVVYCAEDHG